MRRGHQSKPAGKERCEEEGGEQTNFFFSSAFFGWRRRRRTLEEREKRRWEEERGQKGMGGREEGMGKMTSMIGFPEKLYCVSFQNERAPPERRRRRAAKGRAKKRRLLFLCFLLAKNVSLFRAAKVEPSPLCMNKQIPNAAYRSVNATCLFWQQRSGRRRFVFPFSFLAWQWILGQRGQIQR